jgi:hypothetical protein
MGWKLIGKPRTVKATRSLAKQYMEMDPAPHDRPLSERRLAVYQRLLRDGSFRPVAWASAICKATDGVYRVNGKHTSTLLAGLPEMPDFYVVLEDYEADTLEDVVQLYATFDSKMQSRTASDINMSFAATVTGLQHVCRQTINTLVAGLAWHYFGEHANTTHQPAERAELLLDHVDFGVWFDRLLSGTEAEQSRTHIPYRHLARQPVCAAMLACWMKSQTDCKTFWLAVRDETGASPNLPDRRIGKYLALAKANLGRGALGARPVPPREIYAKSISAWNAWRRKESTNLNYYAGKPLPEAV